MPLMGKIMVSERCALDFRAGIVARALQYKVIVVKLRLLTTCIGKCFEPLISVQRIIAPLPYISSALY